MTARLSDQIPEKSTRHKFGRRRFLAGIGASGLAVAAATFGRSTPAFAASCGCCNLAHCPPNTSYSGCMDHATYSWRCYYSSGGYPWQCQCCEQNGTTYSAYACWPR